MYTEKDSPEVIWLAPKHDDQYEREWCEDNVWGNECEDCGSKTVKYIRADLVKNISCK